MKFIKKLMAMLMAICMTLSLVCTNVFAAEISTEYLPYDSTNIVYQDETITIVQADAPATAVVPYNNTTYESKWLDHSATGSFPIYTSNSGTIGITLKVESSSDSSVASIIVQKPDGTDATRWITVNRNTNSGNGYYFHIYGAPSGTYTIKYNASTSVGMRIMCWMY